MCDNNSVEENQGKVNQKWGYVICFGTVITFVAGIGHVNSLGLLYNDFIIETNASSQSLTTAHGVFAVMLAVGGIILNILLRRYTLRVIGIWGSMTFIAGSFATIMISDISYLTITFGVLQGLGFGMMVPVCYATLNYYFVEKRTTVLSIIKALQGIILMGYPQLLRVVMSLYGLRGTLLILAGISTNTLAGMLMMIGRETKKKISSANKSNVNEAEILLDVKIENDDMKINNSKDSLIININQLIQRFCRVLNLNVLKDPVYCNICFGQSFVNFSDLTFFILQPMLLFQYGYTKVQVATCISICSGFDVIGRCALAAFSAAISVNVRYLFYLATLATFLGRILILQHQTFTWVLIWTGTLGFLRAWLHVASPLVVASHVSHADFPGAYAFLALASGVVNIGFSPIIGLLRNVYQDYVPSFYMLAMCCLPCIFGWPLEYILTKQTNQ